MSKMNIKWTIKIKEKMKYKLYKLGQNIELVFADSKEHNKSKNNYLPGSIMNCIRGNITNLYDSIKIVISKLRN